MYYSDSYDELELFDEDEHSTHTARRTSMRSCSDTSEVDPELNESPEERQALLEELKTDYSLFVKGKPSIIFLLNEGDTYEGTTLEQFFHKHGAFPMEEHMVAAILQNVTSAFLFLHSRDVVLGSFDSSSVVLDLRFNAKIIVTRTIRHVKPSKAGKKPKAEDVFNVGLILYRMLTGHTAKFGEKGELVVHKNIRVSEKGMKTAQYMLSKSKRFPPTIVHVRYSDWLEEFEGNPPVLVTFPYDKF